MKPAALLAALAAVLTIGAAAAEGAAPANPLAPLVVPRAQLGKAAQNLQVELLSGTTTNARAADDLAAHSSEASSTAAAPSVSGVELAAVSVPRSACRTRA